MTKTVFDNSMLGHVWAQQKQHTGRSNNGNMFFEGKVLYSYGSHFALGYIMTGGLVALLNSDSYSITTSKHKSYAARAVRHMKCYYVPDLTDLVWALQRIENGQGDKVTMRAAVKARPTMSDDAALYLLRLVGFKAERELERIRAENDKATRAAIVAETKRRLNRATILADSPLSDTRRYLDNMCKYSTIAADNLSMEIFRYLRDFKPKLSARRVTSLKAHRAVTRDFIANYERLNARKEARKVVRSRVQKIRSYGDIKSAGELQHYLGILETLAISGARYMTCATRAKLQANIAIAQECLTHREAQERIERFEREAKQRQEWLDGQHSPSFGHFSDEKGGALLRLKGDTLETSHGARVPLSHAVKVFQFVKLVRARGVAWHTNGRTIRVGHFTLTSIDTEGNFIAGCHTINWPEIERFARSIDMFDTPESEEALS
jgi:hypothetical protein